jgi:tRNA(Ile)-lysidine synthase TilS/MesJ
MRRGVLYKAAKEMGCNKIALGHHYDDVIETTLMNMLNSGSFQTMVPKLHSLNFEGMELIRPMYLIREHDIIKWANHNELKFIQCACKFTEELHSNVDEMSSKRYETKLLIQELKKHNELVEQNIFMAAHNVNIDMIVGYKKDGIIYNFKDNYKENK